MKYKHIFDYFDYKGKWVGGVEPVTESTKIPQMKHTGYSIVPSYILYLGWADEEEANHIFSGCCYPDVVTRNSDTKQLKHLCTITPNPIFGDFRTDLRSKYPIQSMTLELACALTGHKLPESYLEYKQREAEKFELEYKKVCEDLEYFRSTYYNPILSLSKKYY